MRITKGEVKDTDLPWGALGPALITHLAKKYGVASKAQPIETFYPVSYRNAQIIFEPAEQVENLLTPLTRVVHMWHSRLGSLAEKRPARGSYLDVACRLHGV